MSPFNPYLQWLGISDAVSTPNHYRLLGLRLFEDQPAAISAAVTRVGGILTRQLSGPYVLEARRLLGEMETARLCLLNPSARTAYDAALRQPWSGAPPNPIGASPKAKELDPLLPPTSMAWRGAAPGVPLPPSAASPMPPPASPMPMAGGSTSYAPSPPLPPGALPISPIDADAILPPSVGSGPYKSMPLPPGSYVAGGYQPPLPAPPPASVPVYAAPAAMNYPPPGSPAAYAQPPAIPMAAAVAPAVLAIPVAAPAQIATPVYAAPAYSPPSAVPIAQPVLAQAAVPQAAAVATASYAEEPALVAPRARLSWRRSKPPTAGLLLGSATIVLVVVAVLVVAANRPDADRTQQDDRSQVARAAKTDDSTASDVPREVPPSGRGREPADRSRTPNIDGDGIAMSNSRPPAAINPPPLAVPKPTPATPPPAPAPAPKPAIPDAQKDKTVTKALNLARVALSKSDPRTARTHVEAAQKAMAPNRTGEIDRVEALAKYTEEFGNAVRQGIKGLEITGQLPFKGSFAGVVEAEGDSFMLRIDGKNTERFQVASLPAVASLPPEIAYALAENWLSKDAAPTKIILGTYQAMHPRGDRALARTLWQAAAVEGAKIVAEQLLPELSVSLPTAAGMPTLAEDDKPGADGRLPLPRATAQSQARTEVRQLFEADFAQAKDAAQKRPLVAKLLERAEGPRDTAAVRYILLLEAGKLAAEAGDFDRMAAALDKLGEHYAADAIALKANALFEASKTSEGKEINQALAKAALGFCDEAVLSDNIEAATKIAGAARAAALKSGDAEILKQCTLRQKEVRELKK